MNPSTAVRKPGAIATLRFAIQSVDYSIQRYKTDKPPSILEAKATDPFAVRRETGNFPHTYPRKSIIETFYRLAYPREAIQFLNAYPVPAIMAAYEYFVFIGPVIPGYGAFRFCDREEFSDGNLLDLRVRVSGNKIANAGDDSGDQDRSQEKFAKAFVHWYLSSLRCMRVEGKRAADKKGDRFIAGQNRSVQLRVAGARQVFIKMPPTREEGRSRYLLRP